MEAASVRGRRGPRGRVVHPQRLQQASRGTGDLYVPPATGAKSVCAPYESN